MPYGREMGEKTSEDKWFQQTFKSDRQAVADPTKESKLQLKMFAVGNFSSRSLRRPGVGSTKHWGRY